MAIARRSISIQSAAEAIDRSVDAVRALLEEGDLEGHYIARRVNVYVDSLEAYQEAHRFRPKATKKEERKEANTGKREKQRRAESRLKALGVQL